MLWRVDKANTVAGIGEKGRTRCHRGEMSTFAFDAQFLLDAAVLGDQIHQRLRLMGVELIGDKNPGGFWLGLDSLFDVCGKIFFCALWSNRWSNDLTGGHLEIGNQALCAVSDIFELFALDMAWQHRQ